MTAAFGAATEAVVACGIFTIRTCAATGADAISPSPSTASPHLRMACPLARGAGAPGRSLAHAVGSVRVFAEHRIDAAVPAPVEERELAFGRGLVGLDDVDQRRQENALVGAVAVGARAPL